MTQFHIAFTALALAAMPSLAAAEVSLSSQVLVERQVADTTGKVSTKLEDPDVVTPGDKLVFSVAYANKTKNPATDFVVTNPIPSSVAFAGEEGEGAKVSVDGGKTWGNLSELKVKAADGSQTPATTSDVTHVRWVFSKPIAPGAQGKLSFKAIVR